VRYASYVLSGYGVVFASIAGYSVWLLRRGRAVSRRVPPDQRRWSDAG
jgi:heme exporter protein CcmD